MNRPGRLIDVLERLRTDTKVVEVEPGVFSNDYLHAFLLGTRQALWEKQHPSTTITIDRITPESVGALIALFERAVGLYAELIDVNAYHQPGVEAGKKAADSILKLQRRILADSAPAARAFFAKYYDERGYFRHVVRWGANDGPDDAFENTAGWPELHALGASD
jgi:glucose-6-phosphate isomerase